jgi:hypothetical protein
MRAKHLERVARPVTRPVRIPRHPDIEASEAFGLSPHPKTQRCHSPLLIEQIDHGKESSIDRLPVFAKFKKALRSMFHIPESQKTESLHATAREDVTLIRRESHGVNWKDGSLSLNFIPGGHLPQPNGIVTPSSYNLSFL